MLMRNDDGPAVRVPSAPPRGPKSTSETARSGIASVAEPGRLARVLRVEWLGQTAASVCWIASVLVYGISSSGDWLQLCAASAWLLANIAALAAVKAD